MTQSECPSKVRTHSLVARSQSRRVLSLVVADEPEGKADQDRRECWAPRSLRRVSDGRGCDHQESVRRHPAVHRGTATAARCGARVKRSIVSVRAQPTGEMRLDHTQFGNFRHATEHDGSRSGPCEWRWAPSIDKKGKLSRYERPIPH